jgi:hypothetical protein
VFGSGAARTLVAAATAARRGIWLVCMFFFVCMYVFLVCTRSFVYVCMFVRGGAEWICACVRVYLCSFGLERERER